MILMANNTQVICKNVFKNDNKETFTKEFHLKWIELINRYEKNKGMTISATTGR